MTTPAFLAELKAMGLRDVYHIQGFMSLLMKPRNGMPWTPEDKAAIRLHLKSVAASLPMLAVFTLPGGMLLLPLLAWHLDRRKRKLILSISPDSIKTPAAKSDTTIETESLA
jgi:Mg2+/citrate symporter